MAIDHEAHKIRIKAISDRLNHPMTYNDAGAPRETPVVRGNMRPLREEALRDSYRQDKRMLGGR
jgi:hypothetical protein